MRFSDLPAMVQWTLLFATIIVGFYAMCCLAATTYGRPLMLLAVAALGLYHKFEFRSWSSPGGSTRYSRF